MALNPLADRYETETPFLSSALDSWKQRLKGMALSVDRSCVVAGRVKELQSVLRKAYKRGVDRPRAWDEFGDLIALKVLFPTEEGVALFTEALKVDAEESGYFVRLDKRRPSHDALGYASEQFDLRDGTMLDSEGNGIKTEVQVRTVASDAWYMIDHRLRYKGAVELPDEMKRRVLRLSVLAELFDSEVTALLDDVASLATQRFTPVFESAATSWADIVGSHIEPGRPNGLFEELVAIQKDGTTSDDLIERLDTFAKTHGKELRTILASHRPGSSRYVESRDWLYGEPETLMIAELATSTPSKLKSRIEQSDFASVVAPMIEEFKDGIC